MDSPPIFCDNTEYPAGLLRRMLGRLAGGAYGIFGTGDFDVTVSGSTVTVAPGRASVPAPATESGTYLVESVAAVTLTLDPADATRARRDVLVAYVAPPATETDTGRWFLEIRKGDPAATPTAPAVANALLLREFLIPAASAGTLPTGEDRRYAQGQQYISGPALYGNELPAFNRPGQVWTNRATRESWVYNGAGWVRLTGTPVVSTTSEVIAPYTDQVVYDRSAGMLKRYAGASSGWEELSATVPKGKRWRTGAFQTLGNNSTVIGTTGARVQGGMTTTANGLVLPRDGLYKVTVHGYATGELGWRAAFGLNRIRAGVADVELLWTSTYKSGSNDYTTTASDEVPLKGGDEVRMHGSAIPTTASTCAWGITEFAGCRFLVEFVRSLPSGVTPL
ncbi:hypothetical protein JOD54_000828 [Actinokineospora baliensis]|uniref:hypothetical protein n=1 Tax=Actinokineospora baliensis TaxID=547056 RepID=UPI001959A8FD|nr:hypothetical protein [Actinokineospora baliensis]MBM7770624.1 hypothetical protein [Actinokineospora baliensis]